MEATKNGKVSKMESVVTDAGDWVFGATEHLAVTQGEKWDEIPKDKRDTRAVIQAAADAYLNNWGSRRSRCRMARPARGSKAASTRPPRTRRAIRAPWARSRRSSM